MKFLKNIIIAILTMESRLIIAKYRPFIVAVTGSVGKTSTKDAIYAVLKDRSRYVRKSEKSMNSDIGLPLTVIGVPNAWRNLKGWLSNMRAGLRLILTRAEYPDCLILEIGADHPGDIKRVAEWLSPDIAVITRVSRTPVHVEFFASPEEVFEEKASLATAVKAGGTLVLFADDEKVMSIAERVSLKQPRVISFGRTLSAQVRASSSVLSLDGLSFTLEMNGQSLPISVKGVVGDTYEYPLLAAAAVGLARGIPADQIAASFSSYEPPRGRMNVLAGLNGSTLIDDTYNSSPDAALAALSALRSLPAPARRIAVLADMMELGKYAAEEHRRVGREAVGAAAELITVGPRSRLTGDEAAKTGFPIDNIHSFDTASGAAEFLKPRIGPGDIVLVKGSQSMRMERVVKALMNDPDRAPELLVRQEPEWLKKD